MLTKDNLYAYQKESVNHIVRNHGSMLWLDIGLGKTISSLTAIEYLLDSYRIKAALVIAPLKVIEAVWRQESRKWEHTRRLKFSLIRGTPRQRTAALYQRADVYLINYEALPWLVGNWKPNADNKVAFVKGILFTHFLKKKHPLPFDMVVFDEISKMKNSTAKRVRAFTKILDQFTYRVGLTGTPASNGVQDLHGQYLMVDGGHRLGANVTQFRDQWFIKDPYVHKYYPRRGATEDIKDRISDITIEMSAKDYMELPPVVDKDYILDLNAEDLKLYKKLEKEFFTELGDGKEIEAFNAGAKSVKCRQIANGAIYTDNDDRTKFSEVHTEKIDMVEEIIEELRGEPLLICYQFIHDAKRLSRRFPGAVLLDRTSVGEKVEAWNKGEIKILIGHPASMGHGLNLQYGGHHILWFGLPWSLELYDQAIGRLDRQGQTKPVINHRLTMDKTLEAGILEALNSKGRTQSDLRDAVKAYRLKYMI